MTKQLLKFSLTLFLCWCCISCGNQKPAPEPALKRRPGHSGSLVEDNIAKTLKAIDSLEDKKDVYAKRNLQVKVRETLQETDQLCQYFNRIQARIITASGGKDINEINNPGDTMTVSNLMVQQKCGDTVQQYLQDMTLILLKMVKDSAAVAPLLPDELHFTNGKTTMGDWKTCRFSHLSVAEAIELFEKYKYDAMESELIILDRIMRDAERRR